MKVVFVGLSNKIDCPPLCSKTKSGALIDEVIDRLEVDCIKANLVNFAPINERGKLRYPNKDEIEQGFFELTKLINNSQPLVVVGLGSIVCDFLDKKVDYLVISKHPSYISTYKKHLKKDYIDDLVMRIKKMLIKLDKSLAKYN